MADDMDMNRRRFLQTAAAVVISLPVLEALGADAPPSNAPATKGPVNVGPLNTYKKDGVTDTWARSGQFFVVVHQGKLFAPSSICTHKGAVMKPNAQGLYCSRHRSQFTLDGNPVSGPAKYPLAHYKVSVDSDGNVIVDKSKSYDEPQWGSPDSFIEVATK